MGMTQIILAGFGGQGILFAGKQLAYAGMLTGKEVSWLPSYGPEMRGGTANCHVILSDQEIAAPMIQSPDVLIALNLPSLEKFEQAVKPGGKIFYDSSLIERAPQNSEAQVFAVPATTMAASFGAENLANIVMLGKVLKESEVLTMEEIRMAMEKTISARKQNLLELNMKCLQAGFEYQA